MIWSIPSVHFSMTYFKYIHCKGPKKKEREREKDVGVNERAAAWQLWKKAYVPTCPPVPRAWLACSHFLEEVWPSKCHSESRVPQRMCHPIASEVTLALTPKLHPLGTTVKLMERWWAPLVCFPPGVGGVGGKRGLLENTLTICHSTPSLELSPDHLLGILEMGGPQPSLWNRPRAGRVMDFLFGRVFFQPCDAIKLFLPDYLVCQQSDLKLPLL